MNHLKNKKANIKSKVVKYNKSKCLLWSLLNIQDIRKIPTFVYWIFPVNPTYISNVSF